MFRKKALTAACLSVGLALGACGGDTLGPFEPEVGNMAGTFELQATGVQNVSLSRDYTWQSDTSPVDVNQATIVDSGTATLAILDAGGAEVYARSLGDNGTYQTGAGSSGSWTIRLTLSGFSGDLNFRVETP